MRMIVTATPDRQYLGHTFDSNDNPIILDTFIMYPERVLELSDGLRFITSSYIIDAKGA